MPQTITNQARLDFSYNDQSASVLSNIATATISAPLTADKRSVEDFYRPGNELTFAVSFANTAQTAQNEVVVTDDLGTYDLDGVAVTPLTYVDLALLYVNGVFAGNITPAVETGSVEFTIPTVAAGANVLIIYKARVNENAQLEAGSQITNTVSVVSAYSPAPVTATSTIEVVSYADVRITKNMVTDNVTDYGPITYEFELVNYGNTEANNIVLTDQFDPAPANITVRINGDVIDPASYTYEDGLLVLPANGGGELTLPAAMFTQYPETGEVTVTPSSLSITVTGTL